MKYSDCPTIHRRKVFPFFKTFRDEKRLLLARAQRHIVKKALTDCASCWNEVTPAANESASNDLAGVLRFYSVMDYAKKTDLQLWDLGMFNEEYLEHRGWLVDWLYYLVSNVKLIRMQTFYRSILIIDSFLSELDIRSLSNFHFRLVGVTAVFIAMKYEQENLASLDDLLRANNHIATRNEVLTMECLILHFVSFELGGPLPITFLRRFARSGWMNKRSYVIAKQFLKLSTYSYKLSNLPPCLLASAAFLLSAYVTGQSWKLRHHRSEHVRTLYNKDSVRLVSLNLAEVVQHAYEHILNLNNRTFFKTLRIVKSSIPALALLKKTAKGIY